MRETSIKKPGRIKFCPHCHKKLTKSRVKGYVWECKDCDEDFYDFEAK